MALSAKLDLRQTQALVMTPLLMQSIRLLQLTHIELEQFIEQEIEKNPLLERDDTTGEHFSLDERGFSIDRISSDEREFGRGAVSTDAEADNPLDGQADHWLMSGESTSSGSMSDTFDSSLENIFPDDPGTHDFIAGDLASQWKSSSGDGYVSTGGEGYNLEQVTATPQTLRDHVAEQIIFAFASAGDRLIAAELADHLDETGYLRADVEEIAARFGVDTSHIEKLIAVLQGFEPTGLFARDLAECLSLQLRAKNRLSSSMKTLLQNLDLLAKRDFHSLKKLCHVGDADILAMLQEIQHLDPKPGTAFSSGVADSIVPDVQVETASDGGWRIELNPDALPRVLINNSYYATIAKTKTSPAEKTFLSECLQSANWLTRSLDQRAQTILKVASEIVRQQEQFLRHGVAYLKPLNLRNVADAIGMHESTVSRVTANKYMLTKRGVFELRYFFNAAIAATEGGEQHSSQSVRHQIKQLIDVETPDDILSDDTIVDLLKEQGIEIARRTVAKYREGMNIASSVQRRREKKAQASADKDDGKSGFIRHVGVEFC
ncbi:RNA polymerase sigma-54 factor [Phyllobacterium trifolii]|jgi:RNA polymerase sigma-54 factor|uniref:RNA polymerase sigma-54 factor n=1 Tax=Phyllobacterium trifolii TaxID=300193 RepID=A0A839U392_9HYPH|nr:RNA polymerase factor sigma-54 [Phyllobacterium trifolii]MBB3144505.1 RNA polymerase sigma-54 factor [Phyllobacterium trifolii]